MNVLIKEIKSCYKAFGDATIYKVEYQINYANQGSEYSKDVNVLINCYNWPLSKWEKIQLTFKRVSSIRFVETAKRPSTVVFEALVTEINDVVVFDFFPIQIDDKGTLEEDINSDFSIKCKSISYKVLS